MFDEAAHLFTQLTMVVMAATQTLTFHYPTRESGGACDDTVRVVICTHHAANGMCDSTATTWTLAPLLDSNDLAHLYVWGRRRFAASDSLLELRAISTAINAGKLDSVHVPKRPHEDWTYWLVIADVAGNQSCRSNYHNVLGDSLSPVGVGPEAGRLSFMVEPSPVHMVALFRFSLPVASPAALSLYDVSGRQIVRYELGWLSDGPHVKLVAPMPAQSGLYFAELEAGAEHRILRFPVLH